ncbi:uncharacterized protein METZ01_LOCUS190013 [marine metagenome]|uniref:Uncharacterized protein n=1 Tax=marine metagenome TaxID=408172 RepID=A0A382DG98_9ZZZZ
MAMIDIQEAEWRIAELKRIISRLELGLPSILRLMESTEAAGLEIQHQWDLLHDHCNTYAITVRKPPERKPIEQLTGTEINTREKFWSCGELECSKIPRHCSECGLCDVLFGDGHSCKCQLCGSSFTGSNHSCPVP